MVSSVPSAIWGASQGESDGTGYVATLQLGSTSADRDHCAGAVPEGDARERVVSEYWSELRSLPPGAVLVSLGSPRTLGLQRTGQRRCQGSLESGQPRAASRPHGRAGARGGKRAHRRRPGSPHNSPGKWVDWPHTFSRARRQPSPGDRGMSASPNGPRRMRKLQ